MTPVSFVRPRVAWTPSDTSPSSSSLLARVEGAVSGSKALARRACRLASRAASSAPQSSAVRLCRMSNEAHSQHNQHNVLRSSLLCLAKSTPQSGQILWSQSRQWISKQRESRAGKARRCRREARVRCDSHHSAAAGWAMLGLIRSVALPGKTTNTGT